MCGVPFRTAHELVAAAAEAVDDDVTAAELDTAAEDHLGESLFAYVDRDELEAALDPVHSVASRDSTGGPAPAAVQSQLADSKGRIAANRKELTARRETLQDAADRLDQEVNSYV
jgi:Argininosuccinate lyase